MIGSIIFLIVVEGSVAVLAFQWAKGQSNAVFYSVFAGDAFIKLFGLALATWWLLSHQRPYVGPLLTMGIGYLGMSLLQIPFLYRMR